MRHSYETLEDADEDFPQPVVSFHVYDAVGSKANPTFVEGIELDTPDQPTISANLTNQISTEYHHDEENVIFVSETPVMTVEVSAEQK